MKLKRNDRVMYENRLGTVMSDLGYYKVLTKDTWIDVLFDDEEFICQIRKDYLEKANNDIPTYENQTYIKIDTENKFGKILKEESEYRHKLHNLEMYKEIDLATMLMKLAEESMEVSIAIMNEDKENLIEELLDVMQVCIGIAYTQNIDLNKHIEKHNEKLLSRGHKFL